jgi:uncharacterized protein
MKILVDRLTVTPTEFSFAGNASWWTAVNPEQRELPQELLEPIVFRLEAHRMGEDVALEGRAEGVFELQCSRCLARYRHVLSEPFRLILEPAGDRSPADPEAAEALADDGVCLGDEIEAGWFRGNEIHLRAFLREVIALALPVKPLCDEDCAGLCPHCGIELGVERCGCREAKSDSPFAALAALRDRPTGGDH